MISSNTSQIAHIPQEVIATSFFLLLINFGLTVGVVVTSSHDSTKESLT